MKNKGLMITACTLLIAGGMNAQTIYDANRLVGSDLNGTARFVGMGGAMGALGGDITTMSTNPAGIGIYRSNDIMLSFGLNNTGAESDYQGSVMNTSRTRGSFDNMGFVYANKIGNNTALRFVNLGFNYHKMKNFNKAMVMNGTYNVSQTDQMAYMSNREPNADFPYGVIQPEDLTSSNAYGINYVPWLGALGYASRLIDPYQETDNLDIYRGYLPFDNPSMNGLFKSRESGGINAYDFNLSFNISDMFYLGATLGAYDVDYAKSVQYSESFSVDGGNRGNYTLNSNLWTKGAGVDFKLGFILRPVPTFPLRIGFAIHTPTLYNLTDRNNAELIYHNISQLGTDKLVSGRDFTQDRDGYEMDGYTDYKIVTPWKYNFSLGYTIGSIAAIGAEYEYEDHSSAKLKYDSDGYTENMTYENGMMEDMLKGVHTVRLGVEVKPVPQFSVRAGYNYSTGAFRDGAFKDLPNNSIRTDTEYANSKAINNYTIGLGYRGRTMYADLAYQYSAYKSDFYAFSVAELQAAKVNNERHQVLMTLGVRF